LTPGHIQTDKSQCGRDQLQGIEVPRLIADNHHILKSASANIHAAGGLQIAPKHRNRFDRVVLASDLAVSQSWFRDDGVLGQSNGCSITCKAADRTTVHYKRTFGSKSGSVNDGL
jgi:hypothetical protein